MTKHVTFDSKFLISWSFSSHYHVLVDENPQKWQTSEEQLFLFESVWKKIKGTWWTRPSPPPRPLCLDWGLGTLSSAPQREDVEISIKNVTLQLKVRSGRIYCILAANRLIGSNCLFFTQKVLLHVNKSPSLPRTHTISALSIQEFPLLDISPLPQHLSLVNTAIK